MLAAASVPAWADQVTVSGAAEPNGARLSFDWPSPIRYTAEVIGNRLTLRFARPIEASFETALPPIAAFVSSARVRSDGSSVDVVLTRPLGLKTTTSGSRVVVELVDRGGSIPASTTPPLSRPAGPTAAPPAAQVAAVQTPPNAAPRQPNAAPPSAAVRNEAAAPRPSGAGSASNTPAAAPPRATAVPPVATPPSGAMAATVSQGRAAAPAAPPAPTPAASAAAPPAVDPQTVAADRLASAAATLAGTMPPVTAAPVAPVTTQMPIDGAVPVRPTSDGQSVSLRFEWPVASAAAVFRRAGYIWVVFDQAGRLDLSPLATAPQQLVTGAEQVKASAGTVARMLALPGINPHVLRDGLAWILELRPVEIRPDIPLPPEIQATAQQGNRMFIPIADPADPIRFLDPEVGDELVVVPVAQLSRGIDGERQYPELTLFGTAQGIALKTAADGLTIRSLPDGVAIGHPDGLYVTPPDVLAKLAGIDDSDTSRVSALPSGRIFDMARWRRGSAQEFLERKQDLQRRVSEATRITRSQPRLDLAQFFFAHGLASETMGLLKTFEIEDPDLAQRADVRAIRGAAKFALGRFAEAAEDMMDQALSGRSEIELWRGAILAAMGDFQQSHRHLQRSGTIPPGYPRNYVTDIALWATETATRMKDFRAAGAYLDAVNDARPSPSQQARVDYYRARVINESGDFEAAYETWTRLAEGSDRWARIRSEMTLVDELLSRQKIERVQAIQRLESLRFAWRGDSIELDLLARLGGLYIQDGDIRNGLAVMKSAVAAFPENPRSREITEAMTQAFAKMYLDGTSNTLPPLAALALYEDYRELTPGGAQGNEIIRRLADRLVAVDLLERAAALLDRQIKFRLEGVEKARVGAQLAIIRLLDKKPEVALKALDDSNSPGLPMDLVRERNQLRARTLMDLERADAALRLLQGDNTREADLLRADITWKTRRWPEAAQVYGKLLADLEPRSIRPNDGSANMVLNWAISLAMSNNNDQLAQVRQRYGQAMESTPFREAFRMITNPSEGALSDFTKVTQRFQEIDRFQAFMASYRDRLKNQALSAIN
jgi:tetratricopeptide (TPR) repeat protein